MFLCYYTAFENSFLHTYPRFTDYLYKILLGTGHSWWRCYNATADGWEPEVFHNKCDHKPNTVFVARANSWWIFGGRSSSPWNACKNYESINQYDTEFSFGLYNAPFIYKRLTNSPSFLFMSSCHILIQADNFLFL